MLLWSRLIPSSTKCDNDGYIFSRLRKLVHPHQHARAACTAKWDTREKYDSSNFLSLNSVIKNFE